MISNGNHQNMTEGFISTQVVGRGLDERTAKAYKIDLEKFYLWLESGENTDEEGKQIKKDSTTSVSEKMEIYLDYLSREKGLRNSTICRKQRVLGNYLAYLRSQGIVKQYRPLKAMKPSKENTADTHLNKKEVDQFFQAIDNEYGELNSDFRRRVCLRDQVMMKLLFYHGIEVSELLQLEVSDYNRKTEVLTIRGKGRKNRSMKLFSKVLRKQMEEWLEEHEYFERDEEYQGRMFLSKMGRPLSMKMVINIFDKYRDMAGIEKECKPKDLKNSLGRYAKEMVMELEE